MDRVDTDLQVCVLVVVVTNPGAVPRTTKYGDSLVCNAVVRHATTTIRCAFWRALATTMGVHAEGTVLSMNQVIVKKSRGS